MKTVAKLKKLFKIIISNHYLVNKQRDIDVKDLPIICCKDEDLEFMYFCSNLIVRIKQPEEWDGYFRVCDINEKIEIKVRRHINLYFNTVVKNQGLEYSAVKVSLAQKNNWSKFLSMGNYSDPNSRARQFYLTKDCNCVGIEAPSKEDIGYERWKLFILNIDHFLKYIMNIINSNKINVGSGKYETYSSNRAIATGIVAKHIGLSSMVPRSQMALLKNGSRELMGLFVEKAAGVSCDNITDEEAELLVTPALQKSLNNLNILDLICFERDHRPGNYNVVIENGKAIDVVSFDNDSSSTFAPFPCSLHKGSGCSALIKGGGINRPFISKELASNILSLDIDSMICDLSAYLNRLQLLFVRIRVKQLQKAIKKTSRKCNDFLISDFQWTPDTVKEELSGKYGVTYLYKFIHFRTLMKEFDAYNTCAPLD